MKICFFPSTRIGASLLVYFFVCLGAGCSSDVEKRKGGSGTSGDSETHSPGNIPGIDKDLFEKTENNGDIIVVDGDGNSSSPSGGGGGVANTVMAMRFYNGRNHYTALNRTAAQTLGFTYEKDLFKVLTAASAGAHGIWACAVNGDDGHRFLSGDQSCEGQHQEGLLGYLYDVEAAGAPVYRCFKAPDHLITLDANECTSNGYAVEGKIGYAPR